MDEQVKQLAETLKKSGMAASEYDAIEKAKNILNVKTQKSDSQEEVQENSNQSSISPENEQPVPNLDADIKNEDATLNELMKESNAVPEHVEAENNPEKTEQTEETGKVKEEVNEMAEDKAEEKLGKQEPEEDMFEEEKKIDLTKVFNQNK
jgi:hypothetical protein|tara:strand:- start:64 stop:516 length:453 start_codon:yes stop_codon:yes gene_type:complete